MSSLLSPGRNIVLIGMMGAGKTVVGRLIAGRLARRFVDTDALVESEAGRLIAELFEAEGERGFRRREAAAVRRAAALRGQVLAVGGGAVVDPDNVTHLRATGDLVLLDADPAVLADRVGAGEDRPLLGGHHADHAARLADLRAERDHAYRTARAHVVDTTGRSPEEVADAVLAWARARHGLLTREEARP